MGAEPRQRGTAQLHCGERPGGGGGICHCNCDGNKAGRAPRPRSCQLPLHSQQLWGRNDVDALLTDEATGLPRGPRSYRQWWAAQDTSLCLLGFQSSCFNHFISQIRTTALGGRSLVVRFTDAQWRLTNETDGYSAKGLTIDGHLQGTDQPAKQFYTSCFI